MTSRHWLGIGSAALTGAALVLVMQSDLPKPAPESPSASKTGVPSLIESRHPTRPETGDGFERTLEVMSNGGMLLQIREATEFLDAMTRARIVLEPKKRALLLAALEHGSPSGIGEGDWAHLFNNACNVLAVRQTNADGRYLALLERVAKDDSRLVMRLYALQHLGGAYEIADEESRKRLRALVERMLTDPDVQTAGTALVLWRKWEKTGDLGEDSSADIARAMVKDTSRSVDIRVTALHAIGDDPKVIDLARDIAPDTSQPVILRKAAISLTGRYGDAKDLLILRECARENPRLAQAGEPAIRMLEQRLAGKAESKPVTY